MTYADRITISDDRVVPTLKKLIDLCEPKEINSLTHFLAETNILCAINDGEKRQCLISNLKKMGVKVDGKILEDPNNLGRFLRCLKNDNNQTEKEWCDSVDPIYPLRYYQLVAARNILKGFLGDTKVLMYHAPTGAGKTRTAMSIITSFLRAKGPTSVIWLSASSELLDQAHDEFDNAWRAHGDYKCLRFKWYSDNPNFDPDYYKQNNVVIFASLQKLHIALNKNKRLAEGVKNLVTLIVFDEAHQSVAPSYKKIVDIIMSNKKARLLGLSATPGRSKLSPSSTSELVDLYDANKVTIWFDDDHYTNPISYLIGTGMLAETTFYRFNYKSSENYHASMQDLDKIGMDAERNLKIAEITYNALETGHAKVLVFCPSVPSAMICSALLSVKYGISNSSFIHGALTMNERRGRIKRYSDSPKSEPSVIFNYGILSTGFDCPATSAVVIARPTENVGLFSQMVGRAIRGKKSGGRGQADIFTVVDTSLEEFGNIVTQFEHFNEEWKGQ